MNVPLGQLAIILCKGWSFCSFWSTNNNSILGRILMFLQGDKQQCCVLLDSLWYFYIFLGRNIKADDIIIFLLQFLHRGLSKCSFNNILFESFESLQELLDTQMQFGTVVLYFHVSFCVIWSFWTLRCHRKKEGGLHVLWDTSVAQFTLVFLKATRCTLEKVKRKVNIYPSFCTALMQVPSVKHFTLPCIKCPSRLLVHSCWTSLKVFPFCTQWMIVLLW